MRQIRLTAVARWLTPFLVSASLLAVLLTGCASPAAPDTPFPPATSAAPATLAGPPTDAVPRPAATPTPGLLALYLGEPKSLGRGRIVDAGLTPDGQVLAVGWGSAVSLWTAEAGKELWCEATSAPVTAVDVHPKGSAVAAGLADGSLVLFDGATGRAQRYAAAAPNAYWGDVAWSPTADRVAFQFTGPLRGDPIYVLDLGTSTVSQIPNSWSDGRLGPQLAWSPDGTAIWATLGEGCARSFDVKTRQPRPMSCGPVTKNGSTMRS